MPAEWEPHARCWMAWPERRDLWGESLPETQRAYARVARAIGSFEPVTLIASPGTVSEAAKHCEHPGLPLRHAGLRPEGRAISVDGDATILTTESGRLHPNRNPGITWLEAERELCYALREKGDLAAR